MKFRILIVTFLALLTAMISCSFAEELPFFCGSDELTSINEYDSEAFLSTFFSSASYSEIYDVESLKYILTEGTGFTRAIYDDGENAIISTTTALVFCDIVDGQTKADFAIDCCNVWKDTVLNVYKSEDGYWIIEGDNWDNIYIYYIDMYNEICYSRQAKWYRFYPCVSDQYIILHDEAEDVTWLIDRYSCEAKRFKYKEIHHVPYFDENGNAVIVTSTRANYMGYTDYLNYWDYPAYSEYYYLSWNESTLRKVEAEGYDYILYVDPESIIARKGDTFYKIANGEVVWEATKEYFIGDKKESISIQVGNLWQYQDDNSYCHTYLVSEMQYLLDLQKNDSFESVLVGTSQYISKYNRYPSINSRYSSIGTYNSNNCYFDQLTNTLYDISGFEYGLYINLIANQGHIIENYIDSDEYDYYVYLFDDQQAYYRKIVY